MRGRRGQGFLPSNTGEWVIAIVLIVVIVVAIVMTNQRVTDIAGQIPSDTQAAITACKNSGSDLLRQAYCDQLRKVTIAGTARLATCPYIAQQYADALPTTQVDCTSYGVSAADTKSQSEKKCAELFKRGDVDTDTTVNDLLCSSLDCGKLGGQGAQAATECTGATPKAILKGFSDTTAKVCCVAA